MSNTPILSLPELAAAQSQPEVILNGNTRALEAIVQMRVLDKDLTAPPVSPADGDRYIVAGGGGTATGAWAGHENDIAYYASGWKFLSPEIGWLAVVADEYSTHPRYEYSSSTSPPSWIEFVSGGAGVTGMDLGMYFSGGPPSSNQLMFKYLAARACTLPANLAGAYGHIGTNPTSSFALKVSLNGSQVGTITVTTGGVFSFATTGGSPVSVNAGDRIEIAGPSSADATAADVAVTITASIP